MKEKKEKKEKKQKDTTKVVKKKRDKKDKKPNKIIEIIKKKWLIDGTKTFILVAIIVVIFMAIILLMQKLELTPIDLSEEKLYTLTDESKEKVKDIDKDVHIYFVGYSENDANLDLAKQYGKVNEKIVAEAVDANNRLDLVEKYGIGSDSEGIIVECGEKSKVLTANDLVTYDMTTYETISIAEEKFTSAITSVVSDEIPKVYFLEGYSEYSLNNNMYYLNMFLQNEINEIETLNILTTGKIPDDCDTLVITTPSKDFDDIATNAIIDYINSGKNILWLNAAKALQKDMPNVNKILAMYGVNPFEVGVIIETDSSKMAVGTPYIIAPELQYSDITEDLVTTEGIIMKNATKINIDTDKLEELNVVKTDLALASEGAYFRTNFNNQSNLPSDDEEKGPFIVGAELEKTLKEANEETGESAVTSKLVIYGENDFVSDEQIFQNVSNPSIQFVYNKDMILNSIAYLVDRPEDITARKNTGTVTYTATEQEDTIVKVIIFTVPAIIIIAGIVVWQVRRRKK